MRLKLSTIMISLVCTLACTGPKVLETRINNRQTVSLTAEAVKENGRWKVSMLLPAGTWSIQTQESQTVEIISGNPRSTARWTVSHDRWNQQDKPFQFKLLSENGVGIDIAVKYPDFLNSGSAFLLKFLASSGAHL